MNLLGLVSQASSAAVLPTGYQIERSLRFNSADSAYLSRTPASAGNRKTWTWSGWVKRSELASSGYRTLFSSGTSLTASDYFSFAFSNDQIIATTGASELRRTTAVYRDVSAFYHLVLSMDTTQATAANRLKLYVNGSEVTVFATNNAPTQNADTAINQNIAHAVGRNTYNSSDYFNGYMADINFIDGSALDPTSFGEYNETTGVWQPKEYTGSYGTNGFYLDFADNSSTAALGYDAAGSNDWTVNNFSVTAGAGNDSLVDTPTPYGTDTGAGGEVRGNYCTLNSLRATGTISNGNLDHYAPSPSWVNASSTQYVTSGKWYWEITMSGGTYVMVGVATNDANISEVYSGSSTTTWTYSAQNGQKYGNGAVAAYGATWTTNDVIGVALDMDAGTITFYKNGVSQGVAFNSGLSGKQVCPWVGAYSGGGSYSNFGQRPFAYTAPSGFKALVTTNLPDPVIADGGQYFNTVLYTGDGTARSITGVGFQPDVVWIKARSIAYNHRLVDSLRGAGKEFIVNGTDAEFTNNGDGYVSAFNSDGFSLTTGIGVNENTRTYVAWNWKAGDSSVTNTAGSITSTVKANTTCGFSLVGYVGNGTSGATVGHGLGVTPSMIIVKNRDQTLSSWDTYHKFANANPQNGLLRIQSTIAFTTASDVWNNTAPTSTVFTLGNSSSCNSNTRNMIAYCFAEIEGFSKFGSYIGNGSADGPFIYTGFRPAWILMKDTSSTEAWQIVDSSRDLFNVTLKVLNSNNANAEASAASTHRDFLSNGFKVRTSDTSQNGSGRTYIYAAFAENPFKYSLAR